MHCPVACTSTHLRREAPELEAGVPLVRLELPPSRACCTRLAVDSLQPQQQQPQTQPAACLRDATAAPEQLARGTPLTQPACAVANQQPPSTQPNSRAEPLSWCWSRLSLQEEAMPDVSLSGCFAEIPGPGCDMWCRAENNRSNLDAAGVWEPGRPSPARCASRLLGFVQLDSKLLVQHQNESNRCLEDWDVLQAVQQGRMLPLLGAC